MKIKLTKNATMKLRTYVKYADGEVSGLGTVDVAGGDFMVDDVCIFEQTASAVHTELSQAALAKFMHEKMKAGEDVSRYMLWWHSHGDMDVFYSSTDTGTLDGQEGSTPWLLSLITNKQGEYVGRLDVYEPVHIYIDVSVSEEKLYEDVPACKIEIEKMLHRRVDQYGSGKGYNTGKRQLGLYPGMKSSRDYVKYTSFEKHGASLNDYPSIRWSEETEEWHDETLGMSCEKYTTLVSVHKNPKVLEWDKEHQLFCHKDTGEWVYPLGKKYNYAGH
jgi:hypothetical protein